MQTEKLFDTNPYDTEFTAQVVGAENGEVVLDRTLFFPEEGGQTCDKGYLEYGGKQFEVEAVRIEDEVIYHRIDTDELKAGDKVIQRFDLGDINIDLGRGSKAAYIKFENQVIKE